MKTYTLEVTTTDDISFRDIERVLNELGADVEMLEVKEE